MASVTHHLFFLLLLPLFVAVAQTDGRAIISVGDSLTAGADNAWWLSPSEEFAFGFQKLFDDGDHFLLAIWYFKIQENTTVWYANGDNPAPRQSKLELSVDHGLVLSSPQGVPLWRSEFTSNASRVAYGEIDDTGNFMLLGENSTTIWESFNHPTDTLLPNQTMEIGGVLSSRQGPTNFSRGRFEFRLLNSGNAVLNHISPPNNYSIDTYYESGTTDATNETNSAGFRVIFEASGQFYVLRRNGDRSYLTLLRDSVPAYKYYTRAILNFNGVLTVTYHPKNPPVNASWSIIKAIPANICSNLIVTGGVGSGVCGYNSICKIKDDGIPSCRCPSGYSFLDPSDEYSSCRPDFLLCDSDSEINPGVLVAHPNTDWPQADYELLEPSDIEGCKRSCLLDCLCALAIYNYGSEQCWKKRLPVSNGRQNTELNAVAFVKIRNHSALEGPQQPASDRKQQNALSVVVSALLGSSMFVNIMLVAALCLGFFYRHKRRLATVHSNGNSLERNLRHFSYKELLEATKDFKEELGRGSCGIVYKGETELGVVAVKILDRVFQDSDKEFKAEVNVIGQTHHKNLVRLIGYCDEEQHRLLVYEFMSNGTLASFLFGGLKPSWNQRAQIAFGIARGLLYLHEECSSQIIHCDIKPQNVLLDEYHNARISDFGLAKLLISNQSHTKTAIRGTKGYVAPEWFRSAPVSVKVDIYSFGVLLLEIICCRKNVDATVSDEEKGILTEWGYECYRSGRLDALIENDMEAMSEIKMVERFVMVSIWCLQEDPSVRPTMKKVMLMLEGIIQVPAPPSPCPFSSLS